MISVRGIVFAVAAVFSAVVFSAAVDAAESGAPGPLPPADANPDAPLSKKLDEGEGVLKPPRGIDPQMHKPTLPDTGDRMPVIIPPGEPGGDQSVQPK